MKDLIESSISRVEAAIVCITETMSWDVVRKDDITFARYKGKLETLNGHLANLIEIKEKYNDQEQNHNSEPR